MSESTRPRRKYDGARRRQQAQETRARVVASATHVFLERGYTGATIPMIASEAGVALQTVYRAAPSKADLLQAAVLAAVAGGTDRSDVPVEERQRSARSSTSRTRAASSRSTHTRNPASGLAWGR